MLLFGAILIGLVRLLSLALHPRTLTELVARRALAAAQEGGRVVPRPSQATNPLPHHRAVAGCFQRHYLVVGADAWSESRPYHAIDAFPTPYSRVAGFISLYLHRLGG